MARGFVDKVAVVTGAGSGIGRALALGLAARGARVALSDVDEAGLAETVALIGASSAVHSARLDVSDRAAMAAYAEAVVERFGAVHQLYNNAGIGGGAGSVLEIEDAAFERVIAVNLWGVIHGTRVFLPHLIASADGHLVNISSLNGIVGQPGASDYCASKFAVRGFTESVRGEMLLARHPVQVTVVHPGGVRTSIADGVLDRAGARAADVEQKVKVYNEKLLRMPPEKAARIILDGVAAGRPRVMVGGDARTADWIVRLLPSVYPRLIAGWVRRAFGERV